MTATRIHMTLATLFGAIGVVLLAVGSHLTGNMATTAGQMLMFHASAIIAIAVALRAGYLHGMIAQVGLALVITGVALFSLDLGLRAFGWSRLFPMAAPTGGSLTIGGWVVLAISALAAPRRAD